MLFWARDLGVHYDVVGKSDGPPLLLIHGFMSSNTQWDLNVDRLGQQLRLVLVELMGHGSSPAPTDVAEYGQPAVLARLDAIRKELDIDSWFVGGHSLGGATTIRYALANPEQVRGIAFTNTRAAFGSAKASKEVVANVRAAGTDLRSLPYHPIHAKRFPDDIKTRMVAKADAMDPHVILNTVSNRTGWSSIDDLHRLVMPVRLINGRYERAFQPLVPRAQAALATIDIVELDGGHSVNVEQPDAYNEAVLDFVQQHNH